MIGSYLKSVGTNHIIVDIDIQTTINIGWPLMILWLETLDENQTNFIPDTIPSYFSQCPLISVNMVWLVSFFNQILSWLFTYLGNRSTMSALQARMMFATSVLVTPDTCEQCRVSSSSWHVSWLRMNAELWICHAQHSLLFTLWASSLINKIYSAMIGRFK